LNFEQENECGNVMNVGNVKMDKTI